ncbi:hypothetical protein NDU88_003293 [Pleurodeles waltl]|uniref:Uncharacterized protein n=1 Tax=Pleurodeles waltl TaxID=8319 RepID=A0AAV7MTU8_PLEWA|nr:hypothetical protein NDU88_003293 [Pleurodeles waltl]
MDQYALPVPAGGGEAGAGSSPLGSTAHFPDLEAVLKVIQDMQDLLLISQALRCVTRRVTKANQRVSTAEDDLALLKQQVSTLTASMADQQERVEDAENRAWHNNLWLVSLPEALDPSELPVTLEEWF